jgi:hypothetical protein
MFVFIRLLLAHFIGDFPLQLDPIYKLKLKGLQGIVPHAIIIGLCGAAMCWPYLHLPLIWFFLIFMTATHLVQDSIKLNFTESKYSFWSYLLDQCSHVALIAMMFFTNIRKFQPPPDQSNLFVRLYSNNGLVIYLIALINASYNGHYMIRCFKDTFMVKSTQCYVYEKWFGMCERALIVTFFLTPMPLWTIVLLSLALRPLTYLFMKKALSLHTCFMAVPDMVLSWIFGLLSGYILYLLQTRYPVY